MRQSFQELAHPLWLEERWFGSSACRGPNRSAATTSMSDDAVRLADAATELALRHDGVDLAPGQLWHPRVRFAPEMFPAPGSSPKVEWLSRMRPRSWSATGG